MKKGLFIILIIAATSVLIGILYDNTKVIKGYTSNKIGSKIEVKGELIKDDEYKFHTYIFLGEEVPFSSSILELQLYTQMDMDKHIDKYVLNNPKLKVNAIGCEQYHKQQEYFDVNGYSANYQFGIKPNETFKQTMPVGYAKALLNSKNIKIENASSPHKTYSISSLKKEADNNIDVTMNYKILNQYFTEWYNIKFQLLSDKKGVFIVS